MDIRKEFKTISSFDILEELSEKYEYEFGMKPYDVSYWDPSPEFLNEMINCLHFIYPQDVISYNYTYLLKEKKAILQSLGFDPKIKDCIITPNGTASIMLVSHWLKCHHVKKLNLIHPAYFSIVNNCFNDDISITNIETDIINQYNLNINPLDFKNEFFWCSNPLYSTGFHLSDSHINILTELIENENVLILDECVSRKNFELSHILGNHKNFIGIYAPHKSICVNGVKFSIIVFNQEDEPFFDQSIDFLCGGINTASISAINHYLSKEYDLYNKIFYGKIIKTNKFVDDICSRYKNTYYDYKSIHYLKTVYFPNIPAELGLNLDFIWNAIRSTGTIFIPGCLNHFPSNAGLSFRINLARDSPQFRASITRLIMYFCRFPHF